MVSPFGQRPFDIRMEWGPRGARELVDEGIAVAVVVDVLSFTTSVTVAVERGTAVLPLAWGAVDAAERARDLDAVVAAGRRDGGPGRITLSPASILTESAPPRLVLPSPNGSAICEQLAAVDVTVVAASLRNAPAVGRWLAAHGGPVGVVASGERWAGDGSLRPAVEDAWGAGAVIDAVVAAEPSATLSPEAAAARAGYCAVRPDLRARLAACASGVELVDKGFAADVAIAAGPSTSSAVPVLTDGWFASVD
ncbi:hypothetical protein GCM10023153_17730 [Ornithinibacter aureus]|uniref:Probable 2-phosphosulfolactate phosphatase n=1 Tax=Ornithinibacter aureus TaxID=622664 RepID=A0ABP8JTM1_9MICO|nr:2-phosphosulfolactate phosphatase [Ornithinibacter aureus]KAF0833375.1 2-phosphosulfolactate phosphatase [Ornithinibacter aureus]